MRHPIILMTLLLTLSLNASAQQESLNIIPKVQSAQTAAGHFTLKAQTRWNVGGEKHIANYLQEKHRGLFGTDPILVNRGGDVVLTIVNNPALEREGYHLRVTKKRVTIEANQPAGLFYGLQTLLQLLPAEALRPASQAKPQRWDVGCVDITDKPEFGWRGLMLDVSRHWFTKDEVKKYIDELATYKMNVFHWHLTDDQGWRIEIPSLPNLTQKGAWRARRVGEWWSFTPQQDDEASDYGGFYTAEDIREVVAYAADRFVRVIPEVDVPGHSMAALVSYPELACLNAPKHVNVGNKFYGVDENTLCVGNERTYEFLGKVFDELTRLFPDEYIHIGGDECYKGFWTKCPKCQALKKREHLKDEAALQSYFIKRVEQMLKARGRKIIGWDEISEGGLAPEATVMSWRGMKGGINAAREGHHVIMTPTDNCYLDLYQGEPSVEPATYAMCRLSDSYNFNPVPQGIDKKFILGSQGNLWAEMVPTFHHAEYMTWPRGWGLAETLWTGPERADWPEFVSRVEKHFLRAEAAGINYARSMYNAIITPYFKDDNNTLEIKLSCEVPGVDIYYTFDNTDPDTYAPRYSSPLSIPKEASLLRIVTYRDGQQVGKVISLSVSELRKRAEEAQKK